MHAWDMFVRLMDFVRWRWRHGPTTNDDDDDKHRNPQHADFPNQHHTPLVRNAHVRVVAKARQCASVCCVCVYASIVYVCGRMKRRVFESAAHSLERESAPLLNAAAAAVVTTTTSQIHTYESFSSRLSAHIYIYSVYTTHRRVYT